MSDLEEQPRRPVSTALVRVGEKALDAPGTAVVGLVEEAKRSYLGVIAFSTDLRQYRTVAARRFAYEEAKRRAEAGAGKWPAPSELHGIEKEQARRTRLLLAASAGTAVLLLVASVSQYRWDPWLYAAVAAPLVLLCIGKYYAVRWVTALAPVSTPALLPWGIEAVRWWPAAVLAVLVALACEYRGGLVAPPDLTPNSAKGLSRRDWMALWATAERVMLGRSRELTRTDNARPISHEGRELGVSFGVRCPDPISPEDVRALERDLGFPSGASSFVADPRAAGSGDLRLLWEDALPPTIAPRRDPMSLTYTSRVPLALREGGAVTELGLARMRVLLAGNSGTGKSQALQGLIDAACDMPDVDWTGIDVQEGPTLKAYAKQWNCRGTFYSRDEAVAHIRNLRRLCIQRNRQLDEGMDADLDGEVDQWWIVSDRPGRRGHVLFIDELSSLTADREAREELVGLLEVCRKASVSVVMATPDLDKDRVGPQVRDQAGVKVAFGCPFPDAQLMFGKGSTQSGWEPWVFDPADDESPNDAGKSYVLGAGYNRPEVHRWFALPKDEIVARNRTRRLWREKFATPDAVVVPAEDVVDAVEVPEPLATLADLAAHGDVHTSTLLEALPDGWTARGVADALRAHGVVVGNVVVGGRQAKGYRSEQARHAVRSLDGMPSVDGSGRHDIDEWTA